VSEIRRTNQDHFDEKNIEPKKPDRVIRSEKEPILLHGPGGKNAGSANWTDAGDSRSRSCLEDVKPLSSKARNNLLAQAGRRPESCRTKKRS
jgi:hypothetical protein